MAVQGCCKISQDFIWWRIWSWEKECRHRPSCTWKDSEGSIKNVLWDLGMPIIPPPPIPQLPAEPSLCPLVLICSMLHLTGPDDEGLHQRGSTKPLRFCEHKARTKAPEVRILAYQSQLSLARYIHLTMSITPPTTLQMPPRSLVTPQNPFLFVVKFILPTVAFSRADPLLLGFQ